MCFLIRVMNAFSMFKILFPIFSFVAAFSSLVICVFLASTYACQFSSICFYFFDLGRIDGQCLCSSYFVINIVLDQFDWSVLLEKYSAWMLVHCPFWLVKGHHRDLLSLVCNLSWIITCEFIMTILLLLIVLELHSISLNEIIAFTFLMLLTQKWVSLNIHFLFQSFLFMWS